MVGPWREAPPSGYRGWPRCGLVPSLRAWKSVCVRRTGHRRVTYLTFGWRGIVWPDRAPILGSYGLCLANVCAFESALYFGPCEDRIDKEKRSSHRVGCASHQMLNCCAVVFSIVVYISTLNIWRIYALLNGLPRMAQLARNASNAKIKNKRVQGIVDIPTGLPEGLLVDL